MIHCRGEGGNRDGAGTATEDAKWRASGRFSGRGLTSILLGAESKGDRWGTKLDRGDTTLMTAEEQGGAMDGAGLVSAADCDDLITRPSY